MLRLFAGYFARFAAAVAPVAAPRLLGFSFVSVLRLEKFGIPEKADLGVQVAIAVAALAVAFAIDITELLVPREAAKKFGIAYFDDHVVKQFAKELEKRSAAVKMTVDLRLNIMFVRRSWRTLLLVRRFYWFGNEGFNPNHDGVHHDANMWLATRQGLCGRAFENEKMLSVDLRNAPQLTRFQRATGCNEFRLFWWQLRKTAGVKFIVSVPIFRERSKKPALWWKPIGVMNVDAVSEAGADWLSQNVKEVAAFCRDHCRVLAYLG